MPPTRVIAALSRALRRVVVQVEAFGSERLSERWKSFRIDRFEALLARFAYVQQVMPYIAQAMLKVFCRRSYARPMRSDRQNTVTILASWV